MAFAQLTPTADVPPPPAPPTQAPPPPEPTAPAPPPTELISTNRAVPVPDPVLQDISLTAETQQGADHIQQALEVDASTEIPHDVEGNVEQPIEIPSQADTVNNNVSQNSFSMQLHNVTDAIVRTENNNAEPILTPVRTLDVSSISADPTATIDPTLQQEMSFMQTWLEKAAASEGPFLPVISKSQKKKLNKQTVNFQTKTRSQGPLPPSQ